MSRPYDLVLFGATGYTGKLVAAHLARRAPAGLRWALAGRSRGKLMEVRRELGLGELPLVIADVADRASLDALARDARVVCTTVGPYALYGSELVAACVGAGTHTCDLTGEPQWIRRMIDQHHAEAQRTGARIVNCCGYDCIPADLGLLMVQEHARAHHGQPCSTVTHYVGEVKGGASGGTVASMLALVTEASRDPAVRRLLLDPYALNPEGERTGPDGPDRRGPAWDPDIGKWTAPSIMAVIDNRLVRRSHALMGRPWGRDFRWEEVMSLPKGPGGAAAAAALSAGLAAGPLLLAVGPLRRLVAKRLPQPGEGPTQEARESGYFKIRIVGKGTRPDGAPFLVRGRVEGTSDPGYGETAKMLGESALCLALDPLTSPGGVVTPAFAMGLPLLERLRAVGMTFEVLDG